MKMPKSSNKLSDLCQKLRLKFRNETLLQNAFVHRSYLNEHKEYQGDSNERLEFLGDSVLSLVVSRFLYNKLPSSPEGQLTTIRAALVRTETLAKLAKSISLGDYLILSKGEEETGGRYNPSTLANTFEALVGAIYLDDGFDTTQRFLKNTVLVNWQILVKSAVSDNKSKLQEVLQQKYHQSPSYKLLESWGPDHARKFKIGAFLDDQILGEGIGKSKQEAAQNAAQKALSQLKAKKDTS